MTRTKKLCCVDKANVLENLAPVARNSTSNGKEYPEVTVSYEFVDAVAMRLVQWPNSYDVLITENLFGDILTDEASVISGSMGLMPSASVEHIIVRTYTRFISTSYWFEYCKSISDSIIRRMMFEDAFGLKRSKCHSISS
jgi:3-isopropylmalate dehydrogenase